MGKKIPTLNAGGAGKLTLAATRNCAAEAESFGCEGVLGPKQKLEVRC